MSRYVPVVALQRYVMRHTGTREARHGSRYVGSEHAEAKDMACTRCGTRRPFQVALVRATRPGDPFLWRVAWPTAAGGWEQCERWCLPCVRTLRGLTRRQMRAAEVAERLGGTAAVSEDEIPF